MVLPVIVLAPAVDILPDIFPYMEGFSNPDVRYKCFIMFII